MKNLVRSLILILLLAVVSPTLAAPVAANAAPQVSAEELEKKIDSSISKVPEFKFIIEEAKKQGIRVWLFGGTAATFAHYAKWDLQREKGDKRFQPNRFDYDYTNIYRASQDLDIVIDASASQAQALQALLAKTFPHLQGKKSAWEVRLLRQDLGEKEALLDNPDFLNQHTDSHSVGMIELTESNEPQIRDLRAWTEKRPAFIQDVLNGRLHYYFSALHETTARFLQHKNPPIISVVRYYIKAFQFELDIPAADQQILDKVISSFDPKKITEYERSWLEKNVPKLFQNAVNIEYAWNVLERSGLRSKLIAMSNVSTADSAGFWMNKEPLRTTKVGEGSGRTAKELGISIVAHETNSFEAYESITRAHTGDPNVLISREKTIGEAAVLGDGFYTLRGREGARGTKITIRFEVDPNAREGVDFYFGRTHLTDTVIFTNKAALKVIPESLDWGLRDYVRFLAAGDLPESERALLEKLRRRMRTRILTEASKKDLEWFDARVRAEKKKATPNVPLLNAWLAIRNPFRAGLPISFITEMLLADRNGAALKSYLEGPEGQDLKMSVSHEDRLRLLDALVRTADQHTMEDARKLLDLHFETSGKASAESSAWMRGWVSEFPDEKRFGIWFHSQNPKVEEILELGRSIQGNPKAVRAFTSVLSSWSYTTTQFKTPIGVQKYIEVLELLDTPVTQDTVLEFQKKYIDGKFDVTAHAGDSHALRARLDRVNEKSNNRFVMYELSRHADLIPLKTDEATSWLIRVADKKIPNGEVLGSVFFSAWSRTTGPVATVSEFVRLVEATNARMDMIGYSSTLAHYAQRLHPDAAGMKALDRIMKTRAPGPATSLWPLTRAFFLMSGDSLATRSGEVVEILEKGSQELLYENFLGIFNGLPAWAVQDPKMQKLTLDRVVYSDNVKRLFDRDGLLLNPDFAIAVIQSIKSVGAMRHVAKAFERPAWASRTIYMEKMLLQIESISGLHYNQSWERDALEKSINEILKRSPWRESPRLQALLKLNPLLKRSATVANLTLALNAEKKAIAEGSVGARLKPSLKTRLIGPRSCQAVFTR